MATNNVGVLLCNVGTPDAPTPAAVRRYLAEFLSDKRVVEIPRLLWWPILHGIILRFRPKKSAALYQKIWTAAGSPLLTYSQQLATLLEQQLNLPVALGMHYGHPSIQSALENLRTRHVAKLFILPLYPQYSATTTAATFDLVTNVLKQWRVIPEIRMLTDYADDPIYIDALAQSIRSAQTTSSHLLFSFHGIPKRNILKGDPYQQRCLLTAQRVAEALQLTPEHYHVSFQSRLGRAEWLQPYTDKTLAALPTLGIKQLQVICPGFAVDCLETLEEIAIQGKKQFLTAGGMEFHYIPALNTCPGQLAVLKNLISKHIANW